MSARRLRIVSASANAMSEPSSTHLSTFPSHSQTLTPLRPRPTSLISDDGRLSPIPRPSSVRLEASRPLLGGREQYFHPGCSLCSLVASLPSPSDEGVEPNGTGSGGGEEGQGQGDGKGEGDYDLSIPTAGPSRDRDRDRAENSESPPSRRPAYLQETSDFPYGKQRRPSTTSQNGLMPSSGSGGTSPIMAPAGTSGYVNKPIAVSGREVVYLDEEITVYKANGKERLCAEGKHLMVVINRHVERIYDLVSVPS